jgi:hypothetical protein
MLLFRVSYIIVLSVREVKKVTGKTQPGQATTNQGCDLQITTLHFLVVLQNHVLTAAYCCQIADTLNLPVRVVAGEHGISEAESTKQVG